MQAPDDMTYPVAFEIAVTNCLRLGAEDMRFIDGATTTGAKVAETTSDNRSEHSPVASRWIVFALAGATTTRSALDANQMWGTFTSPFALKASVQTRRPK